jgi:ankyrin repeat protein
LDEVKSYFNEAGVLKPPANFQKLQRGFLWACEFGHNDVVEFLLANGADLGDQAGSNQTALHWAVIGGCLSTLDILLKHNAPLEELNAYGGTALGQALWSFLNGGAEIDYVAIVEKLLAAGAKIEDGSLAWLEKQPGRTVQAKAGIAGALRRYGAVT